MPEQLWENEFESFDRWHPETVEVLNDLLRALRRKKGFGLFFVQCNPAQGTRVIAAIRKRFSQKRLVEFELNRQSETLYGELLARYQGEKFEIACVTGVEQALYAYEDTKRLAGWSSEEIYNYSWRGLPPLLGHLNRQREAFEANLPIALIFLVPRFAIDYFVQRAPDFFDWRSGFFKFSESKENLQKACQELVGKEYKDYLKLTSEERIEKILEIKDKIILLDSSDDEQKSNLLREQGLIFESDGDDSRALDCYDLALKVNPYNYQTWNQKGAFLAYLERYEESLKSFDRTLKIKYDDYSAWNAKGVVLFYLGRYEESIYSFDRTLEIEPENYYVWNDRGLTLFYVKRYEEAIQSFDSALAIKVDYYNTWSHRGFALHALEKDEEALESFEKALAIQSDYYNAWVGRGLVLHDLEKDEEALESFERALAIQSGYYDAWVGRGFALHALERYEEALESFNKSLKIKPEYYAAWGKRCIVLLKLRRYQDALDSMIKFLEFQPNARKTWISTFLTWILQKIDNTTHKMYDYN